jgi:hypothetical protein
MMRPTDDRLHRSTARRLAAAIVVALTVAACGGGGETTDQADVEVPDGADADAASDTDGARSVDAALKAADGWGELHDLNLPAPGTAELTVAGETYVAEVECPGPGEIPDEFLDTGTPLNQFVIYQFLLQGNGTMPDGSGFRLSAERSIFVDGDRWHQIRNMGWGGGGQMDAVRLSGDDGVSWQLTPSSRDPEGAQLPLVRVDRDGGVTAQGELVPEFEGDAMPEGEFTLVARCPEGWPQDVIDEQIERQERQAERGW